MIRLPKFWNPIWPPATVLTSNGRQICIRALFWAHKYLMERSRSSLFNGSSIISKFNLSRPPSQKQGMKLICTDKINNPRRGVSIAKTQHNNVLYGCSRVVNVSLKSWLSSIHRKIRTTRSLSVSSGAQALSGMLTKSPSLPFLTATESFAISLSATIFEHPTNALTAWLATCRGQR